MDKLEILKYKFLRVSQDDDTGLWQIISDVNEIFKEKTKEEKIQIIFDFIKEILHDNLAKVGRLLENAVLDAWHRENINDTLALIREEWLEKGSEYSEYGIWFRLTEEGLRCLDRLNIKYVVLSNKTYEIFKKLFPDSAAIFFNTRYENFADKKDIDCPKTHADLVKFLAEYDSKGKANELIKKEIEKMIEKFS